MAKKLNKLDLIKEQYRHSNILCAIGYSVFEILHEISSLPYRIKENREIQKLIISGKSLKPPWVECPEIEWGSVAWRMGYGESYLMKWEKWFHKLHPNKRLNYKEKNPEPIGWNGFYKSRL